MSVLKRLKERFRHPVRAFFRKNTGDIREQLIRLSYLDENRNTIMKILFTADHAERVELYRKHGVTIGQGVFIDYCVWIDFGVLPLVTIEDGVTLAAFTRLIAHDTTAVWTGMPVRTGRILLKKKCYVGNGAMILPGVTVGEGSVVGAAAVVTRDVPDRMVVAGVPAKPVATLDEHIARMKKERERNPENFFFPVSPGQDGGR